MKKKVKRYDEGGILRDSSGNPVRSGSGEVVRTRFPERRSYDEQASSSMTESSGYAGRNKTPDVEDSGDSSYAPKGKMSAADIGFGGGEEEAPARGGAAEAPAAKTFKQAFAAARRAGDKSFEFDGKKYTTEMAAPKSKAALLNDSSSYDRSSKRPAASADKGSSEYGKSERLKALSGTFSSERANKRYAESTPYARAKMGMKAGGKVSSASSRADGIAQRGKTKGRIC